MRSGVGAAWPFTRFPFREETLVACTDFFVPVLLVDGDEVVLAIEALAVGFLVVDLCAVSLLCAEAANEILPPTAIAVAISPITVALQSRLPMVRVLLLLVIRRNHA